MLKKSPGKPRKSLLPPGFVPFADREQRLKDRILTESRSIVIALSQGAEAPSVEELLAAARKFVESLRPEIASLYGEGDNYSALNNLATEADMMLRHDPLQTVCSFSAAMMAITRHQPVRR